MKREGAEGVEIVLRKEREREKMKREKKRDKGIASSASQVKLRPGIEKNLVKLQKKLLKQKREKDSGGRERGGGGGDNDASVGISDSRKSKFVRALASSDWHTRERALSSFETWLSMSEEVNVKDMKKLWKGLYYNFWHSDKVPVQQQLAERLSNVVCDMKMQDSVALAFWETFLETMSREWSSIDRLRLDKFMSLVRMFVHASLVRMCEKDWHPDVVVPFWEKVTKTLLQVNEGGHVMTGFALHLTSVFVDELEQVCSKASVAPTNDSDSSDDLPDTIPSDVLSFFVDPFKILLCTSRSHAVVKRITESIYLKLVKKCTSCLEQIKADADSDKIRSGYPFVQLDALEIAKELFEVAADPSTRQFNREKIYDVISVVEPLAVVQEEMRTSTPASTPDKKSGSDGDGGVGENGNGKVKENGKDKERRRKKKKKGVVFALRNNQIFNFHKKNMANVTYSVSGRVPLKGALKKA